MEISKKLVSDRFKELIDKLGYNIPSFAKALNYQRPDKLYNIFNGIYYPSFEILSDITKYFGNIDVHYLITGKGTLFLEEREKNAVDALNKHIVPLIPYDCWAGNGSPHFCDEQIEEYYYIPEFTDADFLIRVKGDSMSPIFHNRDIVACKKVISFANNNKIHAISTKSMGVLIKRVSYIENGSHITLTSENPDYHPFELPINDVDDIALILGAIIFNLS